MILQAMRERRFARRAIKRLLKAHSAVSTTKPDLSGKELYKEVLLHAQQIDEAYADMILSTVTLMADASDNQGVNVVRFLVNGAIIGSDTTAPYSLDWITTTASNGDVTLTAEAEDASGNIGVSADVIVTVQNAAAATLAQIQSQVFSPICSGCHSGPTSNSLPSGMNLSNANASYTALVNVASLQVGSLSRVTPNNPANSYLIRKLVGTQAVGDRMPQGGPFLNQATIDMIKDWINDGAPNN